MLKSRELINIFFQGMQSLNCSLFSIRRPSNVMILLTNRCNCRCRYCDIHSRKNEELETEKIFSLLKQLKKFGTHRIGFLGGEPLIREDIIEIVKYSKKLGFFNTMNTNAILLKEKEEVIDYLDVLSISLDGKRNNHDFLRGKGTHDIAVKAIEKYSEKITVFTSTVFTKHNINDIDYILEIAKKSNAKATFQALQHPEEFVEQEKQIELFPENNQLKNAFKILYQRAIEGYPVAISKKSLKDIIQWDDYKIFFKKSGAKCFAGKLFCTIDANGKLYNCDLILGKIKGESFIDKGLKNAFLDLKENPCDKCISTCYNEYNNIYSLNPSVIARWLKNIFL